jgi:ABC-type lipoprotein release transport system permease subunit
VNALRVLCVIAWRNLWRNHRRTLLTAATIASGLALLLVFLGLGLGSHRQMLDNGVQLGGAHVAIQARGYQSTRSMALSLHFERARALASRLPAGRFGTPSLAPRLFASGLASSADGSSGVSIIGIDPVAEARVSLVDDRIVAGTGRKEDEIDFLPMKSRKRDLAVIVDGRSAEVLRIVALRPWQ